MNFKAKALSVAVLTVLSSSAFAETEKVTQLETIEITAEQGVKNTTNVVTIEKQQKSTETTLRGVLNDEPAISFGGGNGRSQWVSIRGMGQDQINLVVDGSSTDAQLFHHEGRMSLDPSLIKIVKVEKGAGSASAGIGANNGQIVARTVDATDLLKEDRNVGFKVNAGYASNNEHAYGASVYGRAGKFDAIITGSMTEQSNYKSGKKDGASRETANSALDNRALLAKIGFTANDNHRIVLSHRNELSKGVRNLREEFDMSQAVMTTARLTADQIANGYRLGGATGQRDRSGNDTFFVVDAEGNAVYNYAGNSARYRETEINQTTLEWQGKNIGFISRADANVSYATQERAEGEPLNPPTGTNTLAANINLDSKITDNSLLKYGVNYRNQEAFPTSGQIVQEKTDVGVYVETINKVGPVTVTGGLRYDAWNFKTINGSSRSDYDLNPSLGLIWDVNSDLSLSASHSYATRSPRFVETLLSGNNVTIASDAVADRTRSTEVGFNYERSGFNLEGNYFWSYTDNLANIASRSIISNQGRLKNEGYELHTGYSWNGLKLRAGVAYNEPTLQSGLTADTRSVAMPIGRTWTVGASYHFDTPNLDVGYKGRIVEDSSYVNAGGNKVTREGYNIHDVYANWKPLNNDSLNVNFAVNNIANKYYKSHSQSSGATSLPSVGRDIRVGFNYTF